MAKNNTKKEKISNADFNIYIVLWDGRAKGKGYKLSICNPSGKVNLEKSNNANKFSSNIDKKILLLNIGASQSTHMTYIVSFFASDKLEEVKKLLKKQLKK
ncbi:MAG: hypothetical protein RsTaC01_0948 [Candidatus Paraimprobicoccus trichonymphae]|uniref:Uncharacterized protein n=1 Tax=Candidatus Paraimprobicoccus trichonymphae TaxID=3033793 RepID=A0AA48KZN6_9FIRM|nr:MAG: hypothetical protein RsTaC01_0190 [Candidatus Paraimprobicoccus trichonymphae]BED93009.1 MAG: hypothetical protein RsTaC01_0948 [Candidatus Paraimprobicoccus trichonymphae]